MRKRLSIRKDEQAVSPVIATILMVAITVVLAAVLYVMVTGLLQGPGAGPRSMGVTVSRSTDQTNWSVEIISLPSGGVATSATITILNAGGGTALAATALSSLVFATNGAVLAGDGDTALEVTERVLINRTTYPAGFQVRIADTGGILYSGTLTG